MRRATLLLFVVVGVACADLRSAPPVPDGGPGGGGASSSTSSGATSSSAGGPSDGGDLDAEVLLPPEPDAGVGPAEPCRVTPPACLDPAASNVLEVPTELTMASALLAAKAGDVIQIRSVLVEDSFKLPPSVSLHGCSGATLSGAVTAGGGEQTIDGFTISGRIMTNETGTTRISRNVFTLPVLAVDGSPSIQVTNLGDQSPHVIVLDSRFSARVRGIRVQGAPLPASAIRVEVSNAVFDGVSAPLSVLNEAGGVPITVSLTASTLYKFGTAVTLKDIGTSSRASMDSCIFALGDVVVDGRGLQDSPYSVRYTFVHDVVTPGMPAPTAPGKFEGGDPTFVDAGQHDFRLARGSPLVNRIPGVFAFLPPTDFNGCRRPDLGSADPGAFESQP